MKKIIVLILCAVGICSMAPAADLPDVWIIGEFNEWKVPAVDNANGAVKLEIRELDVSADLSFDCLFECMFYSSEIKPRLCFYYIDPSDGKGYFACGPGCPVSLYATTYDRNAAFYTEPVISEDLDFAKANPYEVCNVDDNRGQWFAQFYWIKETDEPFAAGLLWAYAPTNNPLQSYTQELCVETTDGERTFHYNPLNSFSDSYDFQVTNNCKLKLMVGVYTWMCDQGFSPILNDDSSSTFHIGVGGNPIEIICNGPTNVRVVVDKIYSLMTVKTEPVNIDAIDCLYVIDYVTQNIEPTEQNADKFKKLERIESGVYEGIFEYPGVQDDSKALFRIKRKLDGSIENNVLGSGLLSYGSPVPVEFNDDGEYESPIVWDGAGYWQFTEWGLNGKIKMRVDLNNLKLQLIDMNINGVESINSDKVEPIYFNLQGQRVENPIDGIYIRVEGSNVDKIRLP